MFEPKRCAIERYRFDSSPHLPHMKIINYVGPSEKVLDIGCATGYLAKHLKEKNCYVVGVEIDEKAAKIAERHCDDVIISDVEQLGELPYQSGFFDVTIYSDVLEHLRRPDHVLMKFKRYLARNGYAIASIPNIARFENRIGLLLGKFEYTEVGLLDVTHLRFFTLNTAKRLFESVGYHVDKVEYTGLASKIKLLKFFPRLFANQFIIVAKPIKHKKIQHESI